MAAAACLAPQAMADPLPAHTAAQPAAVTDAASYAGLSLADLLSTVKRAAGSTPAPAQPVSYTVRPGDSLSAIAGRFYHKPSAWPVLYWVNHSKIRWANVLSAGQVLRIPAEPAKIPSAPGLLGPAAPAAAATGPTGPTGSTGSTGSSPAYAPAQATSGAASSYSGGAQGGSFGQCVVARESGGNTQVMNSSGHYGLYQFSESTWVAYGGSAADFGHASAGEQNQVFANALARGGQSNWSAYDGC
ncbi:MAG: LysM peptidoglycan-binding domain-containing protein [Streptosporangiaceae bacterium]